MADNTQLAVAAGGDTIRTLDKTGTGAPKTEVVALDLGGGDGRSELIASYPLPVKLDDVPVDDDGTPLASLSPATLDAVEMLFRQLIAAASSPYVLTATEIAASVTPVNLIYPELDVRRYGALGDGIADDSGAFSTAALVAQVNGGTILVPKPPVTFLLTNPVNFTNFATSGPRNLQPGFRVAGVAALFDTGTAHITIKHTGFAFDCSGTRAIHFQDLTITTDAVIFPQVIFFHARNLRGDSQFYRFINVTFAGTVSKCIRYNYGSEQDDEIGCAFYQQSTSQVGTAVEIVTASNVLGLTSTFGQIATGSISTISKAASAVITLSTTSAVNPFTSWVGNLAFVNGVGGMTQINGLSATVSAVGGVTGAWTVTVAINSTAFSTYTSGGTLSAIQSNLAHRFWGGEYVNSSTDSTSDIFQLDAASSFYWSDSFTSCKGRSHVRVLSAYGTTSYVMLRGIETENSAPLATNVVLFDAATATQTPTGWDITDCYFASTTRAILANANVVLDNFYLRNIQEQSSLGLQCGTLQNSSSDGVSVLTVTTSTKNFLVGSKANMTLTSQTNTFILDKTTGFIYNNPTQFVFGGTTSFPLVVDSTAAAGVDLGLTNSGSTVLQVGSAKAIITGSLALGDGAVGAVGQLYLQTNNSTTPAALITTARDIIARGVAFCLRATTIETRASTTTLTNSTQLTYAIPTIGTYAFEVIVFSYFTTAVTNGITANVNYSGTFTAVGSYLCGSFCNGTTTDVAIQPVQVSATVNNALAGLTFATFGASVTSAAPAVHKLKGNLVATATGTLAFAFAQNSSGVNTANLGVGSYMTVTLIS